MCGILNMALSGRLGDPLVGCEGRFSRVSRFHKRREDRYGMAAVELAILSPFLLAMALGMVDFGRFSKWSVTVDNAARNGALYGSSSPTAAADSNGIRNAVLQEVQTLEGIQAANVSVTSSVGKDAQSYQLVTVTVAVPFTTVVGFPAKSWNIKQTSQMRVRPTPVQ